MRDPLSKVTKEIKPSGIRKFFDIVSEMKDAISLGVGEPDFDTPWHIREEGIYSLEKGRTFYTSNSGLKELKMEVCNYLKRKLDVDYDYNGEVTKWEVECKSQVKAMLKSPSSAKFGGWKYGKNKKQIIVQGYVDAENSFGAEIRSQFQFKINRKTEAITSFIFDGQELMQ